MIFESACVRVRPQLSGYLDGELAVPVHAEVRQHLWQCSSCREDLEALEALGGLLRSAQREHTHDITGLADQVVSRVFAEERESWPARVERAFDDMHLVWAGLCASTAAVVCAGLAVMIVSVGPRAERADSLRAMVAAVAAQGTDRQPVDLMPGLQAPRVSSDALTPFMPSGSTPGVGAHDSETTFAAVVTREGRVSQTRIVEGHAEAGFMESLRASARFEPASRGGVPVAVSLVWLVTHTTVRPDTPADLLKPQSGMTPSRNSAT
jgi:hypothetical protein